jgi:hypothetical protein
MAAVYTNRARNSATNAFVYWDTEDRADPNKTAANAPSPSGDYVDVVTVGIHAVRAGLFRDNLSSQVDGTRTVFTTPSSYVSGSLRVWYNGQRQTTTEFSETSVTTFTTTGFTAASGSAIEVEYRPA